MSDGATPPPPTLQEQVLEALRHAGSTHTLQDLVDAVRQGEAQIWDTTRTVVLTEVVDYPRLTAARIWLVAGNLDDCDDLLPKVEAWAMSKGCTRLEAYGRLGWKIWCERQGIEQVGAIYRKELGP